MHLRLVADEAGDIEPVSRRVPAAAAQLEEGRDSEGRGLEGFKMIWGFRGLDDVYEVVLRSRGLRSGRRVGDGGLGLGTLGEHGVGRDKSQATWGWGGGKLQNHTADRRLCVQCNSASSRGQVDGRAGPRE